MMAKFLSGNMPFWLIIGLFVFCVVGILVLLIEQSVTEKKQLQQNFRLYESCKASGHQWNDCKCLSCGETKPDDDPAHDWVVGTKRLCGRPGGEEEGCYCPYSNQEYADCSVCDVTFEECSICGRVR